MRRINNLGPVKTNFAYYKCVVILLNLLLDEKLAIVLTS